MRYSIFGYLIGEGFRNIFKNKKSTMASFIIMCATMFVLGIFFIIGENVNYMVQTIEDQQGIAVFLKDDATEQQVEELGNAIRDMDYVNSVTFRSKEDALAQVKSMFKERQSLLSRYEGDANPFPLSYVVTLTDLTKVDEVQNNISQYEIVDTIEVSSKTIDTLIKVADGIKMVSGVIIVILILISIFIIMNTIKLTVHARRKEISIMKYVGATNGFIRWPFIVEGMIIGVFASIISIAIVGFAYNIIAQKLISSEFMQVINMSLVTFGDMFNSIIFVYMLLGIGIGALGSVISMRKYLKV